MLLERLIYVFPNDQRTGTIEAMTTDALLPSTSEAKWYRGDEKRAC